MVEGLRRCADRYVKLLVLRVVVHYIVRHCDNLHQEVERYLEYDRNAD